MTTYKPRNDNVLVMADGGEKMRGRLYIPESSMKMPSRGTVVALGPGYLLADGTRSPPDLQVGDRVEFKLHPGMHSVDLDGQDLDANGRTVTQVGYVMKEVDVLCVVDDEPMPDLAEPEPEQLAEEQPPEVTTPGRILLAR